MQLRKAPALVLLVFLCGCQALSNNPLSHILTYSREPGSELLSRNELQQLATRHLSSQEHLKALALIFSAVHQGHPESLFSSTYPQAINGVLVTATQQRAAGDPVKAGTLLKTVYLAYPHDPALQSATSMTLTEIDASIELCASQLLEQGLVAYRNGNLEEAISRWEKIARFHPQHAASQRAIETTRVQLANLLKID